jgi:3-oxoadipate enol-lactonase
MGHIFVYDDDFTDAWKPAETVVLQHGFARNGSLWRGWVPYLGRRYRVLRPDLPGCGRSPDPGPDYQFTTANSVALMLDVLDKRGLERVHYIGDGMGGVLGAALAGEYPDRIASLTLLTTPNQVRDDIKSSHGVGYASWKEAINDLGTREWWIQARTKANDMSGDAAFDSYLIDEVAKTPTHIAAALSDWGVSWSYYDLLPKVSAPTLFAWAEGAKFMPKHARDEVTSLVKDGRQWLAPNVDSQLFHFIYPDIVAPRVAEFLNEVSDANR